jgi:hypothetical protein
VSLHLQARRRDGGRGWDEALSFAARTRESGFRTAARKLGLRGPILSVERVGSSQWAVNVDGQMMMVVESSERPVCRVHDTDDVAPLRQRWAGLRDDHDARSIRAGGRTSDR